MLHPGLVLLVALALFVLVTSWLRWPLAIGLIVAAVAAALLAEFGVPFRHLVEGGFGYLTLILALFAGAFFGQVMRESGAADAVAGALAAALGHRPLLIATAAGTLLYLTGMFVGVAGVAVLAVGVIGVPLLRRLGLPPHRGAAFVAVVATCGMIAPPVNVPAMTIADGVNMPYLKFAPTLLALSLPPAVAAVAVAWRWSAGAADRSPAATGAPALWGFLGLVVIIGFWAALRIFPAAIPDPSVPLVLVVGALCAAPALRRGGWSAVWRGTFSGTPLALAAVLVAVGVVVQIMTLTGIRGWLVINVLSFAPPWLHVALIGMPVLGGVLTSMGAANVLGVPFAFAFIGQDMIINVGALSAVAALSEFMPPTAIAAALAAYVAGETNIWRVIRASAAPLAVLAIVAVALLVFAKPLARYLTG
jgi:TRAP-type C4-dicarboxylate transport system permease large subunit